MKTKSDIRRAVEFMIQAHDGQFRKFSGTEYAWHPVGVAKIVREIKSSKNKDKILIAALLHDTVEDTDVTLEDIQNEFGEMVSSIVYELTSDGDKIKEMGKSNYLLNKMLRMTSYALVVKLADRLHNCSDLDNSSLKFRNKYVAETRFILNGLESRYLSDTHRYLINQINNKISKFELV
jgi:GTP diphosphokinase / guanosine-3',5'-bis(diphosphate) 3'-diphosphatase